MNIEKLKKQWLLDESATFEGWDFSYLKNRSESESTHWDYDTIVRRYLKKDDRLLDMGTGGGEYLLSLNHEPSFTFATEGYLPNFELCQKRLEGIQVRFVHQDSNLPFDDGMFDIIINRHESFDMSEVHRLLKPKGLFITQQVGGDNNKELIQALVSHPDTSLSNHKLTTQVDLVARNGFKVIFQGEDFTQTRYFDVGAIVYFAKIISWEFPGFSVETCFDRLCKLQFKLLREGYIGVTEHRFIIVAQKN